MEKKMGMVLISMLSEVNILVFGVRIRSMVKVSRLMGKGTVMKVDL